MIHTAADRVTHGLVREGLDFRSVYSEVVVGGAPLRYADRGRMSRKRIDRLMTWEPDTVRWLQAFTPRDVFLDVGANVGAYSVMAAVLAGCRVISLEPEAQNFAQLNENIWLNGLDRLVTAYPVAATDVTRLDTLYLSAVSPAYSHHDFGECRWEGPVTRLAQSAEARPRQGCVGFRIDDLVGGGAVRQPTHIKIDVDGLEWRVLEGAWATVNAPATRTVLVEIDFACLKRHDIVARMAGAGWRFVPAQAWANQWGTVRTEAEWNARVAAGVGGGNLIWYRDDRWGAFLGGGPPPQPLPYGLRELPVETGATQ